MKLQSGEYLRVENILQNYDEFNNLKAFQGIDMDDADAIGEFKKTHFVTDDDSLVQNQE